MSFKKIKIILIFSFLLLFLFLSPLVAKAQFTGIFDYFTSSMEGVEEFSGFASRLYQVIGFLLLVTYILLGVTAYLLQWIITAPVSLYNSTLVWSGWNFTLGLANIFFILIFIIIALGYILKIETIGQKKILTNLILVALLVNFSLLLVGAVTDIATFFQNTILGGETNLLNLVFENLMGGLWGMITSLLSWIAGYLLLYAIPFSGPFAQLTLTLGTLTALAVFGPTLMSWILTIFFGLNLAGTLFLYFFFFTIRTYIIWALAVLAPLAFICLILPQTKKWWDEWLKHLLEWTFLGIVLLLWLVLGLKLMDTIMPPLGPTIAPIVGWLQIGDSIKYFLFLFIYLVIGLYISNKTKPALAATATALAGQVGNAILGRVIMPGAKAFGRSMRRATTEQTRLEEEAKIRERPLTRGEKLGLAFGKIVTRPVRGYYRYIARTTPEAETAKDVEGMAGDFEKKFGTDVDSGVAMYSKTRLSPIEKAGLGLFLARKGAKHFQKLSPDAQTDVALAAFYQSPKALDTILSRGNPHLVNRESDLFTPAIYNRYRAKVNTKAGEEDSDYKEIYEKFREEGLSHDKAFQNALDKTVFDRAATDIRTGDIKDLSKDMFRGPAGEKIRQAYIERFGPEYFNQIAMNFDQEVMNWFTEAANKVGAKRLAKKNPALLRYFATFGKERWGWRPISEAETLTATESLIRTARGPEALKTEITSRESELNNLRQIPEAERTSRQRRRLVDLQNTILQLSRELTEAERIERERPVVVPPKPEEEPLLLRMKKATTQEERKKLERAFRILPEKIQAKEKEIAKAKEKVETALRRRRLVEDEIERQKKIGATDEELSRLRTQAEAQQGDANQWETKEGELMGEWKELMDVEKLSHPERDYIKEIIKLREEEKTIETKLKRFIKLKRGPEDIEKVKSELRSLKERRSTQERGLIVYLKSSQLDKAVPEKEKTLKQIGAKLTEENIRKGAYEIYQRRTGIIKEKPLTVEEVREREEHIKRGASETEADWYLVERELKTSIEKESAPLKEELQKLKEEKGKLEGIKGKSISEFTKENKKYLKDLQKGLKKQIAIETEKEKIREGKTTKITLKRKGEK